MAPEQPFDAYAEKYDVWFLKNRNVLASEVRMLARALGDPGVTLSVGCGSGLFESILKAEHGVEIRHGVEPATGMVEIARKRGLEVRIGTAEALPYEDGSFDTVLLNGIPSYVADLGRAFSEAYRVLRPGGHVVVADVPAESSYGLLYRLAGMVGTWEGSSLREIAPAHPYPVEFVAGATWRTTTEKTEVLRSAGFVDLEYVQTLTRHAKFSDDSIEEPVEGYDRGDYVAIRARKPS
jgi:ubiquinone/menaquinone biosynthesis C-methylase UbiE